MLTHKTHETMIRRSEMAGQQVATTRDFCLRQLGILRRRAASEEDENIFGDVPALQSCRPASPIRHYGISDWEKERMRERAAAWRRIKCDYAIACFERVLRLTERQEFLGPVWDSVEVVRGYALGHSSHDQLVTEVAWLRQALDPQSRVEHCLAMAALDIFDALIDTRWPKTGSCARAALLAGGPEAEHEELKWQVARLEEILRQKRS